MSGGAITSVAPTTTVTALTSITTGLTPGEHAMVGYRIDLGGHVVQMLRWGDDKGDLRSTYPPDLVQPCPPFMGAAVPVLSKAELEGSAFTEAHLRGSKPMGWRAASSIAVQVGQLLKAGHKFVYAYYDGVDKIAHERGFGEYYESELRNADRLVGGHSRTTHTRISVTRNCRSWPGARGNKHQDPASRCLATHGVSIG